MLHISYLIYFFSHVKLCLATAIYNFKWAKITDICVIWDQTFTNSDVKTLISLPMIIVDVKWPKMTNICLIWDQSFWNI